MNIPNCKKIPCKKVLETSNRLITLETVRIQNTGQFQKIEKKMGTIEKQINNLNIDSAKSKLIFGILAGVGSLTGSGIVAILVYLVR